MKSKLAQKITSLVITMSIILAVGANILAVSGTPITNFKAGDTIAADTTICNAPGYAMNSHIYIEGVSEPGYIPTNGTWTADQNYLVTRVDTYDGGWYDLYVKPASEPEPQPSGTPTTSFKKGDTIPAGTVIYDELYESWIIFGEGDFIILSEGPWTADQDYVVIDIDEDEGYYYDLIVKPASEPDPQPDPQPGPVDPTPVVLSPEEIREMSMTNFVENLYLNALGRAYDSNGKTHWIDSIHNGATGTEVVWGIFHSEEFLARNLSNEDYVRTLYRVFCNNSNPDAANVASMAASLENGTTRDQLFNQFAATEDWASVCAYYLVNV